MFLAFLLSLYHGYGYFFVQPSTQTSVVFPKLIALQHTWLEFSPNLQITIGIMVDALSVMMMMIVTFVSFVVHLYSLGYMKGEERYATYFTFLSLFTFSMIGLVLSTNIFQMYIFWELVGISSFLLIGFYYKKPSAVAAANKAFIVTRFADFGFLIGILVLFTYTKTGDFLLLTEQLTKPGLDTTGIMSASFLGISALTWGLTLVFVGGAGKSAMFPLHIWLPDAMEGPTPVSALLHAATMVVAGVFLVARLFPVYALSGSNSLYLVAYVGLLSSLLAALIACTQTDIKKILAYSTISQIGLMMVGLGISGFYGAHGLGYTGSLFHLFTHAIFKALLFLAAGAVIHYTHQNDIRTLGGLRTQMPVTHITFLVGCLAISGIPPFAGFFSKEEILLACWNTQKPFFIVVLFISGLTALYMFRLYFSVFWNKDHAYLPESSIDIHETPHKEAPVTMLSSIILLAALSVIVGFIPFSQFVTADGIRFIAEFHAGFAILPTGIALSAIIVAWWLYAQNNLKPENITNSIKGLYTVVYKKFYFDEIYVFLTHTVLFGLIGRSAAWIDKTVIDGMINRIASLIVALAGIIKNFQSGKVQDYALYIVVGVVGFILFFLYL